MAEEMRRDTIKEARRDTIEEVRQDVMEETRQEQIEKRAKRPKGRIVESVSVKIIAFLVLALGFFAGILGGFATLYMGAEDYYMKGYEHLVHDRMVSQIWNDVGTMNRMLQNSESYEADIQRFLESRNLSIEIYDSLEQYDENHLLWSSVSEEEKTSPYHFVCYTTVMLTVGQISTSQGEVPVEEEHELTYYLYVDPDFPVKDNYWSIERECHFLAQYAYLYPIVAILGLLLSLISFIFLMCSAGHHRGKEGITGGILSHYHFDVVTIVFGGVGLLAVVFMGEVFNYSNNWMEYLCALVLASMVLVWGTIYLRELALRLKMGNLFRHTLIYVLLRGVVALVRGLPLVINTCIAFMGIAILELMGIFLVGSAEVFVLWLLEKAILFPIVVYGALMCKRLQKGSEMLAAGNLDCQIDTSHMVLAFKQHGENLNSIAQGMSVAVEQRLKSEHLKTELITNVSHDIKTPLTSIINYANLIGSLISGGNDLENAGFLESGGVISKMPDDAESKEIEELKTKGAITAEEREKLYEYTEVLLRQSRRLKKLLEDLVEASKATTGNLEVHLQSCEVGVLLSQAVGEYEQRFREKGLEMIVKQPEERITVMADGRHIWRVFDNLLNNICKYAQENTRVYLTVEVRMPEKAEIIFRNMSKYPLDIMGSELKERFVRGDKSRHMEGNGLGLSIASSLVELQGGEMEIVTDGDLFKVIIRIPAVKRSEEQISES